LRACMRAYVVSSFPSRELTFSDSSRLCPMSLALTSVGVLKFAFVKLARTYEFARFLPVIRTYGKAQKYFLCVLLELSGI
jgi:hypothetical protein